MVGKSNVSSVSLSPCVGLVNAPSLQERAIPMGLGKEAVAFLSDG